MERASQCSPAAVKIGLLLFFHHGMGKDQITISNEQARRMHVSRNTKAAALSALEAAGLVKLTRVGQKVVVNLCECEIETRSFSRSGLDELPPTNTKQQS